MRRRVISLAAACAAALAFLVLAAQPAMGTTDGTGPIPPGTVPSPADPGLLPPPVEVGPSLPVPAPSASFGGPDATGAGDERCGLIDVGCHVNAAIDGWLRALVVSALDPVLDLLGRTVLATPEVTGGTVATVWGATAGVANALVVLLLLAGGAVVMSHETLQTRYTAKDIAPRIVVAVVAANASLALVGSAVGVANALSRALLGGAVDPSGAAAAIHQLVAGPAVAGGIFLVLLGLVAAALGVILLVTCVIRVALLVVLVGAAPLALVCHALPQTESTARLWWRGLAGLLAVQLGQSLVLVCALRVFFTPDGPAMLGLPASVLVNLLVAICLLWVMVRIPAWVSKAVFGPGRASALGTAVKVAVVYRVAKARLAVSA